MKLSCDFFNKKLCSSCSQITLDLNDQLTNKISQTEKMLDRKIDQVFESPPSHFRDKVKWAVGGDLINPKLGLINSELEIIDLTGCQVQNENLNQLVPKLKAFIKKCTLTPYNIMTQTGELKYLIAFESLHTNERYLRFILRSKESLDRIKKNISELTDDFHVISVNLQPLPAAILEGEDEILLSKNHFINHQLNQEIYKLHPQSFVQTNTLMAEKLYKRAKIILSTLPVKTVIDLFCGHGPFALSVFSKDYKIYGYEINKNSIQSAIESAHIQQKLISFFTKNTHELIELPKSDLMIVNPPRGGLGVTLKLILKNSPDYILYSSCNLESLSSDLKSLAADYEIQTLELFDMFPHTHHHEILALLKKIS
jgi:23S rRNA (uracil747-C5)-methyltransferase